MLGLGQGGGLQKCLFWGGLGMPRYGGALLGLALYGEHNLSCKWPVPGRDSCEGRSDPAGAPLPAQVPVQLCEKCRAWKSLGLIAECLECKHFPGKGGQST